MEENERVGKEYKEKANLPVMCFNSRYSTAPSLFPFRLWLCFLPFPSRFFFFFLSYSNLVSLARIDERAGAVGLAEEDGVAAAGGGGWEGGVGAFLLRPPLPQWLGWVVVEEEEDEEEEGEELQQEQRLRVSESLGGKRRRNRRKKGREEGNCNNGGR